MDNKALDIESIGPYLEKHLDATGHTFDDPGRRLAATIRKRRLDDPSGTPKERKTLPTAMAAYDDLREAVNEYDEFVAFMAERIPTGARTNSWRSVASYFDMIRSTIPPDCCSMILDLSNGTVTGNTMQ